MEPPSGMEIAAAEPPKSVLIAACVGGMVCGWRIRCEKD